ncbi:glycosyltransferase family 2 protein [Lamprobacter modestohalophilus]|nr:glycosyltransferase family A protein [Lamprobacter modestohalophilus]
MPPADPLWPQALARYPFATALLPVWREHAADLPADYQAALDAALIAFDPERPLDERYRRLIESRDRLAALAADGDAQIATQLLRIRAHRACGEPDTARQLNEALLQRIQAHDASKAQNAPEFDRPFLPALESFDQCAINNPQDDLAGWLTALALDTAAELNASSRHAQPAQHLSRLAQRRKLPCASIERERMLALAALRLGKKVTIKPEAQLVEQSLNAPLWLELGQMNQVSRSAASIGSRSKRATVIYDPERLQSKQRTYKLCVGVPVYNEENYIQETIRSLKIQDIDDVKFLISNNCSTDRTLEIIQDEVAGDERFEIFQQPTNVGGGDNFVFLFENSRSELFMWLGAHDYLSAHYLKTVTDRLDADASLSMVCGYPYAVIDGSEDKKIVESALYNFNQDDALQRYLQSIVRLANCTIFHSVFPRKYLADAEFRKTISWDHVLISRLLSFGKLQQLEEVRYYRRYFRSRKETQDERFTGEQGLMLDRRDFYQYYLDDLSKLYKSRLFKPKRPLKALQSQVKDLLKRRWEGQAQAAH